MTRMTGESKKHPPRWAERFLSWYCKPDLLEDLQGDLSEYFARHVKAKGLRRARLIYILDVFKFLRIYTIRKPHFINLLIQWIMIGSYIKTSGRSIVRNKLFSSINIIGLAISMSVGLLVIAFVSDLLSYDNFHEKKSRIYRVNSAFHDGGKIATSSVAAGKKIQSSIAGIERVSLMRRGFGGDATVGEKIVPVSGIWADESFFKIFSFPVVEGNPAQVLKDPYSVVLTEKTAMKLFGASDALGKSIKFGDQDYIVTGIIKDLPKLSHMRFDLLASFATVELQKPDMDGGFMSWDNVYSNYTYILLPEGSDPSTIQASLDKIARSEKTGNPDRPISLVLQPLSEIPFSANMGNPIGPSINKIGLYILGGLAIVVILSACFNYTNLSIARSLRRSREVGIRKVIGALRSHVLGQFIAESVIISLMALSLSFLLFLFLRDQFLAFHPFLSDLLSLELSPALFFWFVLLAVTVGVTAGFLPALFFSKINAVQVLKDVTTLKVFRNLNMRKALILTQYTFSLIFITSTLIGYKQYKAFLTFDLGFKTENILNIKLGDAKSNLLMKELSAIPEVTGMSRSVIVTSLGSIYGMQVKHGTDSVGAWLNVVDENYLPLHEHKFLAGKNFVHKAENATETEIIVNEQILKKFNIGGGDPGKALGEELILDGRKVPIIGVVKDFHYGTLENTIEPLVLRYASGNSFQYVNAKVKTTDWPSTRAAIEAAWQKIDKIHPLDAAFYDDQIEQAYSQFSVMLKVIGFLAFLAVCIASMGLFGMVVFTTESKLKEISIRKVLGASEGKLVILLSKGFMILLGISAAIALPATWLFFDKVVLVSFKYHQQIEIPEMITGFIAVMLLAGLMIGSQTLKVARTNPAEVLKNE